MLICRYKYVYLHDIFAYENISVMTFKCIFGHYGNKRFVERIPQFHVTHLPRVGSFTSPGKVGIDKLEGTTSF